MKKENSNENMVRPESAKKMTFQELREEFEPAMQEMTQVHAAGKSLSNARERDRVLENKKHTLHPMGPMSMS